MARQTLDHDFVAQFFATRGCTLLDRYERSNVPMRYVCGCGRERRIRWGTFQQGYRQDPVHGRHCVVCRRAALGPAAPKPAVKRPTIGDRNRLTVRFLRTVFARAGCRLVSDHYQNVHTKLDYVCSCGNEAVITYYQFSAGTRCRRCRADRLVASGNQHRPRLSFSHVRQVFGDQGCELLEDTYVNSKTPLRWACSCGNRNPRPMTFDNFARGQRCVRCGVAKRMAAKAAKATGEVVAASAVGSVS